MRTARGPRHRMLGFDDLSARLLPRGREEVPWSIVASILTISRFCHPSIELHVSDTWYRATALDELLGVPIEAVTKDRLYSTHDRLLPLKEDIEKHLKERFTTLFDAKYDLLLYDVTSAYFEGMAESNEQAQRGHTGDHRPDCKQVCIGLVVTRDGLPVAYEGLTSLATRLEKAKKKPNRTQVERQIGRLLGKNSRSAGLFEIHVNEVERDGRSGLQVTWAKRDPWRQWSTLSEGCYLLRTNLTDWSVEDLWQTYIQLTEAEAAFRTQKSELVLRPMLASVPRPFPGSHPLQLPGLCDVEDAAAMDGTQRSGSQPPNRHQRVGPDQAQ